MEPVSQTPTGPPPANMMNRTKTHPVPLATMPTRTPPTRWPAVIVAKNTVFIREPECSRIFFILGIDKLTEMWYTKRLGFRRAVGGRSGPNSRTIGLYAIFPVHPAAAPHNAIFPKRPRHSDPLGVSDRREDRHIIPYFQNLGFDKSKNFWYNISRK